MEVFHTMKTCEGCGKSFLTYTKIDGEIKKLGARKFCLECSPWGEKKGKRGEYKRRTSYDVRKVRKAEWLSRNGSCSVCGSKENIVISPDTDLMSDAVKRNGVQVIWSWISEEKRESELAKCTILCGTCFSNKQKRDINNIPHGTETGYRHYGCRCDLCKSVAVKLSMDRGSRGRWNGKQNCVECGTAISSDKKVVFCSEACKGLHKARVDKERENSPEWELNPTDGHYRRKSLFVCDNCGKDFYSLVRSRNKNANNFCSVDCSVQHKKKMGIERGRVELECRMCGSLFTRKISSLSKSKSGIYFCSRKCTDLGRRVESGIREVQPSHYGTSDREKYFKISAYEYNIALDEQNHKCAICGKETKLVVDHDHELVKFRGLLCSHCNTGLGMFFDNPEFMRNAAEYIERNRW